MTPEKIITHYWAKPIPPREFDWSAVYDGYEGGDPIGYGATEAEAIRDLTENYPRREQEGLSVFGIRVLGLDTPCRCGHEDGLHDPEGHCAVIGCPCTKFDTDATITAHPAATGSNPS